VTWRETKVASVARYVHVLVDGNGGSAPHPRGTSSLSRSPSQWCSADIAAGCRDRRDDRVEPAARAAALPRGRWPVLAVRPGMR
jgi:hypothetical protein